LILNHITAALLPIFLLILIGYLFRKNKFPNEGFWPSADKLTYYVLMPSLLVFKLSQAKLNAIDGASFVLTGTLAICIAAVGLILINKKMAMAGASFTSVMQGGIRFNTYVFLALSASLFGDEGLILSALLITIAIPLLNIVCITVFAVYGNDNTLSIKELAKSIISNPLIVACFIGAMVNVTGLSVPLFIDKTLQILSSAALPMGLLSVGVGLELRGWKQRKNELLIASFFKLLLLPLITFGIGVMMGLDALSLSVVVIFAAMPTAPSAFVLARQLGGDVRLMSSIITVQTLLSLVTMAAVIELVSYY